MNDEKTLKNNIKKTLDTYAYEIWKEIAKSDHKYFVENFHLYDFSVDKYDELLYLYFTSLKNNDVNIKQIHYLYINNKMRKNDTKIIYYTCRFINNSNNKKDLIKHLLLNEQIDIIIKIINENLNKITCSGDEVIKESYDFFLALFEYINILYDIQFQNKYLISNEKIKENAFIACFYELILNFNYCNVYDIINKYKQKLSINELKFLILISSFIDMNYFNNEELYKMINLSTDETMEIIKYFFQYKIEDYNLKYLNRINNNFSLFEWIKDEKIIYEILKYNYIHILKRKDIAALSQNIFNILSSSVSLDELKLYLNKNEYKNLIKKSLIDYGILVLLQIYNEELDHNEISYLMDKNIEWFIENYNYQNYSVENQYKILSYMCKSNYLGYNVQRKIYAIDFDFDLIKEFISSTQNPSNIMRYINFVKHKEYEKFYISYVLQNELEKI